MFRVNRNALPMFAEPAESAEEANRVVLSAPVLDLPTTPQPDPEQVVVDLDASDAAERVAEMERRARAVSALGLIRSALYGEQPPQP